MFFGKITWLPLCLGAPRLACKNREELVGRSMIWLYLWLWWLPTGILRKLLSVLIFLIIPFFVDMALGGLLFW